MIDVAIAPLLLLKGYVIMTKRADDLKLAGVRDQIVAAFQHIEKVFVKLKLSGNVSINFGARYIQDVLYYGCTYYPEDYTKTVRI